MSLPNCNWTAKAALAAALLVASVAGASARTVTLDSKLNLRGGPGQNHRVVVVMPAGATVKVGNCDGEWCRVEYRNHRGFVSSALLKGGDGAYAAAPAAAAAAPAAAQPATKYDPDDAVRVLNWNDREWRDRYWREMELRKR